MVNRKDILKVMSIILITLYRKYNLLLYGIEKDMPIAELFLQNIFSGNPSRKDTDIIVVMFGLFETVIFNLLFGSYIYHDLYENSAYIFVRQKSRKSWFARKSMELLLYCIFYNFLFIGITFGLCVSYSNQKIDFTAVKILILTYVFITLFTFWTALLVNITAMVAGATTSFIATYIVLTFFSAIAVEFEAIPIINRFPILLKLNPVANVIINWNDEIGSGLQPVVYFIILCVLTCAVGCILVSRLDISIKNRE